MISIDQDLRFLKEAVGQLQEYLLSNELYWPLNATLPRLTPGALLLSLARCQMTAPLGAQNFITQIEAIRNRWRSAWEKKSAREFSNRLRLWSEYLSDCIKAPDQNFESYRTEVRGRTILQLLLIEMPEPPELKALTDLDAVLKTSLIPGEFLWELEIQPFFPKSDFWFLYGEI